LNCIVKPDCRQASFSNLQIILVGTLSRSFGIEGRQLKSDNYFLLRPFGAQSIHVVSYHKGLQPLLINCAPLGLTNLLKTPKGWYSVTKRRSPLLWGTTHTRSPNGAKLLECCYTASGLWKLTAGSWPH